MIEQTLGNSLRYLREQQGISLRALAERNYRRIGLGISLLVIGATLIGLQLWIRELEL